MESLLSFPSFATSSFFFFFFGVSLWVFSGTQQYLIPTKKGHVPSLRALLIWLDK